MPKQTETFDEMDRLRDAVKELETNGVEIANALTEELDKNTRLTAELEALNKRGSNSFPSMPPNDLMLYATMCAVIAFVMSIGPVTEEKDYEFNMILGIAIRFCAQLAFVVWCIAIQKRDGYSGLFKKLAIWTVGWGLCVAVIAHHFKEMPLLGLLIVNMATPANWWLAPAHLEDSQSPFCLFMLLAVADITTECAASRKVLSFLILSTERIRGWAA